MAVCQRCTEAPSRRGRIYCWPCQQTIEAWARRGMPDQGYPTTRLKDRHEFTEPYPRPVTESVCVPMNDTLRAASVQAREYGHPLVLVAHVDTPAETLLAQATRLRAQSRFAELATSDREWDPE